MLDADRAQVYNIFAESTTFMLQILMLNGNESFWQICADEMLETRTDGTFVWFGVASTASSLKKHGLHADPNLCEPASCFSSSLADGSLSHFTVSGY